MVEPDQTRLESARIDARAGQYATYLEWTERLLDRRAEANRFYMTLNLAIVGAIGFTFTEKFTIDSQIVRSEAIAIVFAVAGLLVSYTWLCILASHKRILMSKYAIVHRLEEQLPLRPYREEWEDFLAKLPGASSGHFERRLPVLFMLFYVIFTGGMLYVLFGVDLIGLVSSLAGGV